MSNEDDISPPEVPEPALPKQRSEPLPWEQKKDPLDDAFAESRIQAILNHPSYQRADQDPTFLRRADTRGPRLELDYLKPELLLQQHGIQHTVVVFGSTRICEPSQARRNAGQAETAAKLNPHDVNARANLDVANRILAKSKYYEIAREFGRIVGRFGNGPEDSRITLMTGGGPGIMEAANRGAFDVGAKSIGLNITLPHEQFPNPYVTPELCFNVRYFAIRKLHFLLRAKALVVFPGGFGTLDELFETLTLIQTRKINPLPVVLVGEEYWRRLFEPDFLVDEGVIDAEDRELFWFAQTASEAWDGVVAWHLKSGTPL